MGIDGGFLPGNIGLEGAHLRRFQRQAQTQFALAQGRLGLLQVRDINHRADGAHGLAPVGRVAVKTTSMDGNPANRAIGAHDAM